MSVIDFISDERVNAAWSEYEAIAVQLRADPHLLSDRAYNERLAKAHDRWRRLFLRQGKP